MDDKDVVNQNKFPHTYAEIIAAKNRIRASGRTLKIALVGPCKSGKTRIANQVKGKLSGMPHRDEYDPTMGVRILEFDVDIQHDKEDLEVKVELWDLSGDSSYESCYPAVCDKLEGVVVVFDPEDNQQNEVPIW